MAKNSGLRFLRYIWSVVGRIVTQPGRLGRDSQSLHGLGQLFLQAFVIARVLGCPKRGLGPDTVQQPSAGNAGRAWGWRERRRRHEGKRLPST